MIPVMEIGFRQQLTKIEILKYFYRISNEIHIELRFAQNALYSLLKWVEISWNSHFSHFLHLFTILHLLEHLALFDTFCTFSQLLHFLQLFAIFAPFAPHVAKACSAQRFRGVFEAKTQKMRKYVKKRRIRWIFTKPKGFHEIERFHWNSVKFSDLH